MKRLLLIVAMVLVSACSNLPPLIQDPPLYDLPYQQAVQHIGQFKEAPVRWGGVIIDVQNEQSYSLVQVLAYPLNNYGRPQLNQPNEGRFLVKSQDFLDPAIYKKDAEITVAGVLKGDVERSVGNKTLRLPLLAATVLHLWPAYQPNNYYYGGYGGYYGGFGYGYPYGYYGSPFWGGYFWPYRY